MKWDMERIGEVIAHACQDRAQDRYQSAAEMLDDLESAGDFAFRSMFDEIEPTPGHARTGIDSAARLRAQILYLVIRSVPWIAGLVALWLILDWLRDVFGRGG